MDDFDQLVQSVHHTMTSSQLGAHRDLMSSSSSRYAHNAMTSQSVSAASLLPTPRLPVNVPNPTYENVSSCSDSETVPYETHLSEDISKLVPKIRKSKLTSSQKKHRSKQTISDSRRSLQSLDGSPAAGAFALPANTYAYHRLPHTYASGDLEKTPESQRLQSSNTSANSDTTKQTTPKSSCSLPMSPCAVPMSPCSTSGSHVSSRDVFDIELFKVVKANRKRKLKPPKSKHKNIVDPVFVAKLENITADICRINLEDEDIPAYKTEEESHETVLRENENQPLEIPSLPMSLPPLSPPPSSPQATCADSQLSIVLVKKPKKYRKRRQIQDGLDMIRKPSHKKKQKAESKAEENAVAGGEPPERGHADVINETIIECKEVPVKRKRGRPRKDATVPTAADGLSDCNAGIISDGSVENSDSTLSGCEIEDSDSDYNANDDSSRQRHELLVLAKHVTKTSSNHKRGRPRKQPDSSKSEGTTTNKPGCVYSLNATQRISPVARSTTAVSCGPDTSEINAVTSEAKQSSEIALQADLDIQCDLDESQSTIIPADVSDKEKGIEIGVQAYPEEIKELAQKAVDDARRKSQSEIATQVGDESRDSDTANSKTNQDDTSKVTQPLQIQVNFDLEDCDWSGSEKLLNICRRSPRAHPPSINPPQSSSKSRGDGKSPRSVSSSLTPSPAASAKGCQAIAVACVSIEDPLCSIGQSPNTSLSTSRGTTSQLDNLAHSVTSAAVDDIPALTLHTSRKSPTKSSVSPACQPIHSNKPAFQAAFESFLTDARPVQSSRKKSRNTPVVNLTDEALLSSAYEDNERSDDDDVEDNGSQGDCSERVAAIECVPSLVDTVTPFAGGSDRCDTMTKRKACDSVGGALADSSNTASHDRLNTSNNSSRSHKAKVSHKRKLNRSNKKCAKRSKIDSEQLNCSSATMDTAIVTPTVDKSIDNDNLDTTTESLLHGHIKKALRRTTRRIQSDTSDSVTSVRSLRSRSASRDTTLTDAQESSEAACTEHSSTLRNDITNTNGVVTAEEDKPSLDSVTSNLDTTLTSDTAVKTGKKQSCSKQNGKISTGRKGSKKSTSSTQGDKKLKQARKLTAKSSAKVSNKSNTVESGSQAATKKDVIVIGSSDDDNKELCCGNCKKLQRRYRNKKKKCRSHRTTNLAAAFQRVLTPASSPPRHNPVESDQDCVILADRLKTRRAKDKARRLKVKVAKKLKQISKRLTRRFTRSRNNSKDRDSAKSLTGSASRGQTDVTSQYDGGASKNRSKRANSDSSFNVNESRANTTDTVTGNEQSSIVLDETFDALDSLPGDSTVVEISPETSPTAVTTTKKTTRKRANTNSEYMPLPVIISKKKKLLRNDMGYSQPRKKRRKRGKDSSEADTAHVSCRTQLSAAKKAVESIEISSLDEDSSSLCHTESESLGSSRPGTPSTPANRSLHGLPKKGYQRAGLFSNVFKDEELSKRVLKKLDLRVDVYDPNEHEFGVMPAPIHVGKYLREKKISFCLPYDVWYLNDNNLLKRMKLPSPKYRKIRNNVYVDTKGIGKYEIHPCNCRRPADPTEKSCIPDACLNRMIFTECAATECPAGDTCSNNRIQRHQGALALEKFLTKNRGYGVKTKLPIIEGEFIVEYIGEVVSEKEFQRRMVEDYAKHHHHYCLNLDSGRVIDGYRMGNLSRFVNHSCEPNCEMQKWNVNGSYRMGLFSIRDVEEGEELSYDYNFHSYKAQQVCHCGAEHCRGVIGGRPAQRLNGLMHDKDQGKDKSKRKSKKQRNREKDKADSQRLSLQSTPMRPLSHRERCYVQKHAIFLLRNLSKVRQIKEKSGCNTPVAELQERLGKALSEEEAFHTHFMALNTARTVRTRGLSVAQENPELAKMAKLAQVLQIIYVSVSSFQDTEGVRLSQPLEHCPSKKKNPEYYDLIKEPIDLKHIEDKVMTGQYKTLESFEADFLKLFRNVELYCGKYSEVGGAVATLEKVFYTAKSENILDLDDKESSTVVISATSDCDTSMDVSKCGADTSVNTSKCGADTSTSLATATEAEEEEEIIRCVCNIFRDEGMMLQCEKCETWQHVDCMGEPESEDEKYMCEKCDPRPVSREVLMKPLPDDAKPDCTYYLTLLRDDELQVRVGECFYIIKRKQPLNKKTTRSTVDYVELQNDSDSLGIFRIDRLWTDSSGDKFAFGHHYLRPRETFHEANRKFFLKELFRIPQYEVVPLSSLVSHCIVMDLNSYCRGRPKGIAEKDVYVCEYRVDKNARMFSKISKHNYPINTKNYCFDRYPAKLRPRRTYSPFDPIDKIRKRSKPIGAMFTSEEEIPLAKIKQQQNNLKIEKKKQRLHILCDKLQQMNSEEET